MIHENRGLESAIRAVVAKWNAGGSLKDLVESLARIRSGSDSHFIRTARNAGLAELIPLADDDWEDVLGPGPGPTSMGLFNLGVHLWRLDGREELALGALREAVEEGSPEADAVLGEYLHWLGRYEEARVHLERSVRAQRGTWTRSAGLLGELRWIVDDDASDGVLALLEQGATESHDFDRPLAEVLTERGDHLRASQLLVRAIENGDDQAALLLGNLLWERLDDREGAQLAFEQGIRMNDGHSAYNLYLLLEQGGRLEESAIALRQAAAMGDERALIELRRRGID